MYIFELKLSEKARGYCIYVFLVNILERLPVYKLQGEKGAPTFKVDSGLPR